MSDDAQKQPRQCKIRSVILYIVVTDLYSTNIKSKRDKQEVCQWQNINPQSANNTVLPAITNILYTSVK